MSNKTIKRGLRIVSLVKAMKTYWIVYRDVNDLALEIHTMTLVFGIKDVKDALSIFNKRNKLNVALLR